MSNIGGFPILTAIIATPAIGALIVALLPAARVEAARGRRLRRHRRDLRARPPGSSGTSKRARPATSSSRANGGWARSA